MYGLQHVPKGRYLLRNAIVFKLSFEGVIGVSIIGGALDAKGTTLWACKLAGSTDCPNGGATVNVLVRGVKVNAAGNSPNTDGIHVQLSRNVAIFNTSIKTGDDSVSIGPGTKELRVEQITCGPGRGISIGNLAKDLEEEGVQNVTVKNAIFKGTQNGLRIKSWGRPRNGFVQGAYFLDVVMFNVQNPIVIDQNYYPQNINCPAQVSGAKVSDVVYQNILGTSATAVAIKFDCSATNPCSGIRLENVSLTCRNQEVQSHCANAIGKIVGTVQPNSCL
ncbi:PREDICTED: polygalacturonase [Prunus dulcis]|uniref:PREDICTED: polygalacturonase n=1 Tax=Prunus dulcis TaxID=3755 RepID=A0A5E4GK33_PRUDU|nr:PREDICTED: polygalacturonase [Prunus dulcis]